MNTNTVNTTKPAINSLIEEELKNLRAAGTVVKRIRLFVQQELEQVKKVRAEVERCQRETAAKANSQAQRLLLGARLATQKEAEEIKRKAIEGLQNEIADFKRKADEKLEQEIADFKRKADEKLEQEIAEFKQTCSEELEKVLADIRVIRIAAREELQAQRKYTDAARIYALSLEFQEEDKQSLEHAKQTIEL